MKNKEMKAVKKGLLGMLVAVMACSFTGCGSQQEVESDVSQEEAVVEEEQGYVPSEEELEEGVATIGFGETVFHLDVVDINGSHSPYTIQTDAQTVGEALLELEIIEGDDSEYGMMIHTVLGSKLDYNVDNAYWAFYIDGEYAQTGVDSTDIVEGATYEFKAEAAY